MRFEFVCMKNKTHWINEDDAGPARLDQDQPWHDFCPICCGATRLFNADDSPAEFTFVQVKKLAQTLDRL